MASTFGLQSSQKCSIFVLYLILCRLNIFCYILSPKIGIKELVDLINFIEMRINIKKVRSCFYDFLYFNFFLSTNFALKTYNVVLQMFKEGKGHAKDTRFEQKAS